MKKKAAFIVIFLSLLPEIILGIIALWFITLMPSQSGSRNVQAVKAPAKIYRDGHGIPHIFANSLNDGYAALGYLHASDRMFQMEMMRRAGTGRLAEILGKDLINYDKKMRSLGFYKAVQPYYDGLSADTRSAMDAYASGVNAYLAKNPLPAEFTLLNFKPTPWHAWDGLIWAKMMAWQLSGNLDDEIFRAQLLKKGVVRTEIEKLYPVMDKNVPVTTKPMQWMRDEKQGARGEEEKNSLTLPHLSLNSQPSSLAAPYEHLPHTASNAYVIAGAHTQNTKPILANDPHLQLQSPILWYLARIVTPDLELKGATAPGMPFFPLGQNGHVAWGFTTSNMDVQDITFIDANEKNLTTRDEVIRVKDGADIHFAVEENAHGIVVSGIIADITAITPPGKKALLQCTAFAANDRTSQALFNINRAHNLQDMKAALADYSVPPQNMMLADNAGHIAYHAVGMLPNRKADGMYADVNALWNGLMNAQKMPKAQDPAAGILMTANNAVVDDKNCAEFTCAFARDWSEPYRAMQLEKWFSEKFKTQNKFDVGSASGAMLETTSAAAVSFLPVMLKTKGMTPQETEILNALRGWDGNMLRDKAEPAIYHVWLNQIMRQQFGDAYHTEVMWPRMRALENSAASLSPEILHSTLAAALAQLGGTHGKNWHTWRWGDIHQVAFKHPLWSHVPIINELTSLKTETDGDGYTLRRAAPGNYNAPYDVEHGAGYRGIYDLGDPAQSRFIIATGQSAQLFSKHYGDLRDVWNAGAFVNLTGDAAALQKQGASLLTLTP